MRPGLLSAFVVAVILLASGGAHAEGTAPAQATPPDVSFAIHPLSASMTWWGGTLQIAMGGHGALAISGAASSATVTVHPSREPDARRDETATSARGEIGYFLYTASPARTGLYGGPSLLARPIPYAREGAGRGEVAHVTAIGAAIDIGAQVVTRPGLSVSAGYGLQVLSYALPRQETQPHLLPRFVLALGWSL
jgi:hypothetical protein